LRPRGRRGDARLARGGGAATRDPARAGRAHRPRLERRAAPMLTNTVSRRIEWGDRDPAGIVFNPRFFAFFDDATAMLFEAAGWPLARAVAEFGILGWP